MRSRYRDPGKRGTSSEPPWIANQDDLRRRAGGDDIRSGRDVSGGGRRAALAERRARGRRGHQRTEQRLPCARRRPEDDHNMVPVGPLAHRSDQTVLGGGRTTPLCTPPNGGQEVRKPDAAAIAPRRTSAQLVVDGERAEVGHLGLHKHRVRRCEGPRRCCQRWTREDQ